MQHRSLSASFNQDLTHFDYCFPYCINGRLENNENKPVTNSRDTQEAPYEKGKQVLKIIHHFKHTTSIFDDFLHYEQKQEEEQTLKREDDPKVVPNHASPQPRVVEGGYLDEHKSGGRGGYPNRGPPGQYYDQRPNYDRSGPGGFRDNRDNYRGTDGYRNDYYREPRDREREYYPRDRADRGGRDRDTYGYHGNQGRNDFGHRNEQYPQKNFDRDRDFHRNDRNDFNPRGDTRGFFNRGDREREREGAPQGRWRDN